MDAWLCHAALSSLRSSQMCSVRTLDVDAFGYVAFVIGLFDMLLVLTSGLVRAGAG